MNVRSAVGAGLCSLTLVGLSLAQSPLQTNLVTVNQGNLGGGLYFDLEVRTTVSISAIDCWAGTLGTAAGPLLLEVWLGPTSYLGNLGSAALWSPAARGIAADYVPMSPNHQLVQFRFLQPLVLGPGDYGVALRSTAVPSLPGTVAWNHAYTNGASCSSSQTPGSCANTVHATNEVTVRGGAAQNAFLSGLVFTPRMWAGNLYYGTAGAPIALGAAMPFGAGCEGSGGVPELWLQSQPVAGQSFLLDVQFAPPGFGIGFWVVGLSNTAWYYLPLPLDLGFIGMPGCRQHIDILHSESFGPGAPAPRIDLPIPGGAGLVGQRFFVQALLVDPNPLPGNLAGGITTSAVAAVIGR